MEIKGIGLSEQGGYFVSFGGEIKHLVGDDFKAIKFLEFADVEDFCQMAPSGKHLAPHWVSIFSKILEDCRKAGIIKTSRGFISKDGVLNFGGQAFINERGGLENFSVKEIEDFRGAFYEGGHNCKTLIENCDLLPFATHEECLLFLGALLSAPICGALQWRPHYWITAPAGTGKTWLINNILKPFWGDMATYTVGGSTIASLRAIMNEYDGPVCLDEAEFVEPQEIMNILRVASSGEVFYKMQNGTPTAQTLRSQFFLFSITKNIFTDADTSRFINFEVTKSKDFDKLKEVFNKEILLKARAEIQTLAVILYSNLGLIEMFDSREEMNFAPSAFLISYFSNFENFNDVINSFKSLVEEKRAVPAYETLLNQIMQIPVGWPPEPLFVKARKYFLGKSWAETPSIKVTQKGLWLSKENLLIKNFFKNDKITAATWATTLRQHPCVKQGTCRMSGRAEFCFLIERDFFLQEEDQGELPNDNIAALPN